MMWNFSTHGDSPALIEEGGLVRTYADLEREGRALVKAVGGRCLVFCLCTNTSGSLMGYAAFLNHRVVPLLLDEEMDHTLLATLFTIYKPDYLWRPKGRDSAWANGEAVYEAWGYELVKTPFSHAYPLHDDLCLLLTTSGSTGSPKLVRHTYENLRANIASIVQYLEIDATERPITSLPMHYTYGLSILNTHLQAGASMILTGRTVMQREFWDLFRQFEATSIAGVPYTYEMLYKLHFLRMKLPSLRSMNQAGGKLAPELQKEFIEYAAKTGRRFYVMYGQTEASPRMGYLPWDRAQDKYGCMGIAIPGGEFELIDVDGNPVTEPDVVGELIFRGPNVTPGYAEKGEDLALGDERNGVLVTGDMAKRDAEGFYTIVGRKKRFLKIFGNRVGLDETERLVKDCFPDLDCACAGKDNLMYVFVTREESCDEVRATLAKITGLNPVAFRVKHLEQIPQNSSGKVLYSALQNHYDD